MCMTPHLLQLLGAPLVRQQRRGDIQHRATVETCLPHGCPVMKSPHALSLRVSAHRWQDRKRQTMRPAATTGHTHGRGKVWTVPELRCGSCAQARSQLMARLVSLLKPSRRKPRLAAPVARLHHVAAAQDLGPGAGVLLNAQVHGVELAGACTEESAALCGAMYDHRQQKVCTPGAGALPGHSHCQSCATRCMPPANTRNMRRLWSQVPADGRPPCPERTPAGSQSQRWGCTHTAGRWKYGAHPASAACRRRPCRRGA